MITGQKQAQPASLVDRGSIRVLVIGCVLIVAVTVFMSLFSVNIMKNAILSKLKSKDMVNLSQSYGAVIEGKIDRAVDASLMLADDPEVSTWLGSSETDARAGRNAENKMSDLVHQFGYATAFLASNRTYHYWSYHDDKFELLNTLSAKNAGDAWFFSTLNMRKRYEINIDYNASLKNTYVWINVLTGDIGHPTGIAGLGMNLGSTVQELIEENRKDQSANEIWLVNSKGVVQLATNVSDSSKSVNALLPASLAGRISGKVNSSSFQVDEYTASDGQLYDISYRQIRDTDWKLVIRIPRTETTGFLSVVSTDIIAFGIGIVLIVLLLFFLLVRQLANPYQRALRLNQQLEQIVALRTGELEDRNQKIQDGIDYARSIQQTILPTEEELRRSLKDYFVFYEPKETVGGDFYWARRVAGGQLLAVADCTGHGVAGALMTTAVNAMLNQITEQHPDDPAQILTEVDRRIHEFTHADGQKLDIPYGLDAAVLYIPDAGAVLYCSAALSAFVWDGRALTEIPPAGPTIDSGNRKKARGFRNCSFDRREGLVFYLATDGFCQQPGGQKTLPYGKTRLRDLLAQVSSYPMDRQRALLQQALQEYQGDEQRRDDVTVLGFQL